MLLNECIVTKGKFHNLKGKRNPCNGSKIDDYLKDYRNLFLSMLMLNDGILKIFKIHSAQTNKF